MIMMLSGLNNYVMNLVAYTAMMVNFLCQQKYIPWSLFQQVVLNYKMVSMNTILKSDEIPNDNLYYEDSYEVIVNSGTE